MKTIATKDDPCQRREIRVAASHSRGGMAGGRPDRVAPARHALWIGAVVIPAPMIAGPHFPRTQTGLPMTADSAHRRIAGERAPA